MANQKIEQVVTDALQGEARRNALDFVAYLREKGIEIGEGESYWDIQEQGETICFLWIDGSANAPGPWTIWSAQVPGSWAAWEDGGDSRAYAPYPADERTKEIAWAHANVCGNCGGCETVGGQSKTILSKRFDGLCNSTLAFTGPDAEEVACAKKMVEARMEDLRQHV